MTPLDTSTRPASLLCVVTALVAGVLWWPWLSEGSTSGSAQLDREAAAEPGGGRQPGGSPPSTAIGPRASPSTGAAPAATAIASASASAAPASQAGRAPLPPLRHDPPRLPPPFKMAPCRAPAKAPPPPRPPSSASRAAMAEALLLAELPGYAPGRPAGSALSHLVTSLVRLAERPASCPDLDRDGLCPTPGNEQEFRGARYTPAEPEERGRLRPLLFAQPRGGIEQRRFDSHWNEHGLTRLITPGQGWLTFSPRAEAGGDFVPAPGMGLIARMSPNPCCGRAEAGWSDGTLKSPRGSRSRRSSGRADGRRSLPEARANRRA